MYFINQPFWWGRRQKTMPFNETTTLVLSYSYVGYLWVFQLAHNLKYTWVSTDPEGPPERPVTTEEMERYQVKERLHLNPWWHYGLWTVPVAILLAGLVFSIMT